MAEFWLYPNGDSGASGAFSLTQDTNTPQGQRSGDVASLTFWFSIKRTSIWDRQPRQGAVPTLWLLGGDLFDGEDYRVAGGSLVPYKGQPLRFADATVTHPVALAFRMPRGYVQHLEERRPSEADMNLRIHLWGVVHYDQPQALGERVATASNSDAAVRIARSDWTGSILPALGYPQERTLALPHPVAAGLAPEVRAAVAQLDQAFKQFAQGEYRPAVHTCRQAMDALLEPGDKKTWSQRTLEPVIHPKKAAMLDACIDALNRFSDAASHADRPPLVEIDRDSAEFVLGVLAMTLTYIGRKLQ